MREKAQKKKPGRKRGRKLGVKIAHGAYSLIARGEFPSKRRYIERWLAGVRVGLIRDLGPTESDLSTGQAVLIDRVVGKLGILRCIEEYVREKGIMKGGELSPCLGKNYLGWANSLRLDLMALGISTKAGDAILTPLEIAAEIDAEKDEAQAEKAREAAAGGPGAGQGGRSAAGQDEGKDRKPAKRRRTRAGAGKEAPGLTQDGRTPGDEGQGQGAGSGR